MFSSCAYLLATKEALQGRGFPNSSFEICALIWDFPISLGMLICINIQNNPSQDSCYLGLKGPSFLCALCKWTCRPNLSLLDSLKYPFSIWWKTFQQKSPLPVWKYPVCSTSPAIRAWWPEQKLLFFWQDSTTSVRFATAKKNVGNFDILTGRKWNFSEIQCLLDLVMTL